MIFIQKDLEELKQIHLKETGILLSDMETLEMGIRLLNLMRIIARKIPENNRE